MKPADHKIYLASKSPRRRELLRQIGVEYELLMLRDQTPRGPEVSEEIHPGENGFDYVTRVAREKAEYAANTMLWRRLPVRTILAADTTVVIGERILAKPADATEAIDMLRALSDKTHHVMTSVAVWRDGNLRQKTQTSQVTFAALSEESIRAYCATSEPYDKAGAYGIQGTAAIFITSITGSHSGIMGLPLYETAQLLQEAGIRVLSPAATPLI